MISFSRQIKLWPGTSKELRSKRINQNNKVPGYEKLLDARFEAGRVLTYCPDRFRAEDHMHEIIKRFIAECNRIAAGTMYPKPIWDLCETLACMDGPEPLPDLRQALSVNGGAYSAAVTKLKKEWTTLSAITPRMPPVPPSTSPMVSNAAPTNSRRPLPPTPVANPTSTPEPQPVGRPSVSSSSLMTPFSAHKAVQSPQVETQGLGSLADRLESLRKSTLQPIRKQEPSPQGRSATNTWNDIKSHLHIDESYLQQLNGKELTPPRALVPKESSIKKVANRLLDEKDAKGNRRVVNEMEEVERTKQAQFYAALIQQVLQMCDLKNPSKPQYWLAMGKILSDNPKIPYVCDGAAALAFYQLYENPEVESHLAIVEQGRGNATGHWFVVAAKEATNLTPKPGGGSGQTVVDVWGANFNGQDSAVGTSPFVTLDETKEDTFKVKALI